MSNIAVVKIDNCINCPHHKRITSAYTGDSFDMADEDSICVNPATSRRSDQRGAHETVHGRMIYGSERWWKKEYTAVPDWCPLLPKQKAAEPSGLLPTVVYKREGHARGALAYRNQQKGGHYRLEKVDGGWALWNTSFRCWE